MSALTGTWSEVIYQNSSDFAAVASTASEASLLGTLNEQPIIPALFFLNPQATRRAVRLVMKGVFSNTGTPTLTFQIRLGTTAGSSFLSGTSVGVSAAITTASGVTNKYWELVLDLINRTPGIGTGNDTIFGAGYVASYSGFGTPFFYPLEPSTPDTATWTATIDGSLTQYLNASVTWSASSSSNTITAKQVSLYGLN